MSGVVELVIGKLEDFDDGEKNTRYSVAQYSKLMLPCDAPDSLPDAEYFWSVQNSSGNSTSHFTPVQLDSRRQIDQKG